MAGRNATALDEAQANSESLSQLNEIVAESRDDVLTGEVKGAVSGMGLGASPVAGSPDAIRYVRLYHAYDGRSIEVPVYMVTSRNNSMLTNRFEIDDTSVPPEYRGKQVWFTRPQPGNKVDKPFKCRLSVDASLEMRAEMLEAGLSLVCRKPGGWATQYEADEHFRIKHKQRWAAWQRYLTEKRENRQADSVTDVIKMLAEQIAKPVSSAD